MLVVREGMQAAFTDWQNSTDSARSLRLVAGGKERQDSVWNGLAALSPGAEIVAIQDAARPCTSQALIAATVAAARETGAAVAAQAVTDTIKESRDGNLIERTLDRSRLWAVQTPQTFRVEIIRRALSEVRQRGLLVTDDTAACELIGQPVQLVVSAQPNPKVTRPEDLGYVEAVLRGMTAQVLMRQSRKQPCSSPGMFHNAARIRRTGVSAGVRRPVALICLSLRGSDYGPAAPLQTGFTALIVCQNDC